MNLSTLFAPPIKHAPPPFVVRTINLFGDLRTASLPTSTASRAKVMAFAETVEQFSVYDLMKTGLSERTARAACSDLEDMGALVKASKDSGRHIFRKADK
jgi:hypothetical protein